MRFTGDSMIFQAVCGVYQRIAGQDDDTYTAMQNHYSQLHAQTAAN